MTRTMNGHFLITKENPASSVSEAYKTLRTNIRFCSVDRALKVLLVTSAGPSEGRTTTATNLAVTYAQENKKVLLIDGDLRKPSIHSVFFRSNRKGLTELLTDQISLADAIVQTDIPNLSVLTSGAVPPNPSEMLGSRKMRNLIIELEAQYDVILIDSPPALAVTDAQILGAMSDGVILVVNYGKVTKEAVRRVRSNMEHVSARILGVVLNKSSKHHAESYYQAYYGGN